MADMEAGIPVKYLLWPLVNQLLQTNINGLRLQRAMCSRQNLYCITLEFRGIRLFG
jgi:hypothetical protein